MFNKKIKEDISSIDNDVKHLKEKLSQLSSENETLRTHISELQATDYIKVRVEELLEERQKKKMATRDEMKASSEPYFDFLSENYDPNTGQVEIKADWNSAFIEYLKKNGFEGNSEEDIFYQYLRAVAQQYVAEEMEKGYS